MEVVPLTPTVVDSVTFDRAPLGRRGYNEDQVDDLLDRVQATLAGTDNLTAQNVRDVVFDPAAFIRRGYHEDQVDEFLDLVIEELTRREANKKPRPSYSPSAAEQTTPMMHPARTKPGAANGRPGNATPPLPPAATQPASDQTPPPATPPSAATKLATAYQAPVSRPATTQPPTKPPTAAAQVVPQPAAAAAPSSAGHQPEPGQATSAPAAAEPHDPGPATVRVPKPDAWRDSDHLALPLPPAPPGERGYRPGDVERLMKLLATTLSSPEPPDPEQLANLKLTRTFFVGQGYHVGAVDVLRQAWLDVLNRRAL